MELEDWPSAMKVYNERVQDLFGMPISGASQSGNVLSVRFSKGNYDYKDSNYFLDPKNLRFSHLTTYRGLFGIINSGALRLYNLINSNDPNELFSIKGIPTYENVAENIKPYVYTFSFGETETMLKPKMWSKYGQVAINFEIVNDPLQWEYYRISNMHYGESEFVPKYAALLKLMHEQYSPWKFDPDLESMLGLLAFHKEEEHKDEQEVRLLFVPFLLQDRHQANYDYRVSEMRTGLTKYIEIPLFVGNENVMTVSKLKRHPIINDDSRPLIKITSIEFGDNEPLFDQTKLHNLKYELNDYLRARFGYRIEVKDELFKTGVEFKALG